jgi:microcystin-dependent protein
MNPEFLGSLLLLPYDFVPEDFESCDGQLYPTGYSSLFELLGTQFGGDGEAQFALPDLSKRAPVDGLTYVIATRGASPR